MRNVKAIIGSGFKAEKTLFGISISNCSAWKFKNAEGNIVVALGKNNEILKDNRVYRFKDQAEFEQWIDEIYNKNGVYKHYGDGNLLIRAFPSLAPKKEYDYDYE